MWAHSFWAVTVARAVLGVTVMSAGSAHLPLKSQSPQATELGPQAALWAAGRAGGGQVPSSQLILFKAV